MGEGDGREGRREKDRGKETDKHTNQNAQNRQHNKRQLSYLAWNVEGLLDKLEDDEFYEFITNHDICCLSETFTRFSFDFNIKFKDYIYSHCEAVKYSHMGRASGGLLMLIKKDITEFVQIIETNAQNILGIVLSKHWANTDKDILILGTYVHPADSIFYTDKDYTCTLESLEHCILEQIEAGKEYSYIIGGDLNARISDWALSTTANNDTNDINTDDTINYPRNAQDTITNGFSKRLIELCTTFNMTPLNGLEEKNFDGNYTFHSVRGNSTIDHFLCSTELLEHINGYQTLEMIQSMHLPIKLNIQSAHTAPDSTEDNSQYTKKRIIWNEEKKQDYLGHLENETSKETLKQLVAELDTDIEASLEKFYDLIKEAGKGMVKTITTGGKIKRQKEWYDKECRNKKKVARQALTKLTRTNKKNNPVMHEQRKTDYIEKRTEYHKTIKEKKKAYRKNIYNTLVTSNKDSRTFWKTIKSIRHKKTKPANINSSQWETHFSTLLSNNNHDTKDNTKTGERPAETQEQTNITIQELDKTIETVEVSLAMRKLKNGKAPGIDEIPPEFLKAAENTLKPFLTKLFNTIYQKSYFPLEWCKAIIVPLYKKGNKLDPANYRGISLLSIISKLFTAIINNRLYNWAEHEDKISKEQAGFRKNFSTTDHIFTLHSMISNCLYGRRRSKLYVAFIDYQKAFDSVKRELVWQILEKHKISTKMLSMLKNIYKNVQASVKHGNTSTKLFDCPSGVKQGCNLSPLIFSLLITEVATHISTHGRHGYQFMPGTQEIFSLLFADDIALIATTPTGLQNQINNLKRASNQLGLTVNLTKTKIMVFRKGGYLARLEKWFYGNEQLEVVNNYKYLGYTLTTKLSVDISLAEYAGRAKGKIVEIIRTIHALGHIDLNIYFKLFDTQVKPLLLYAAEIWGTISYKTLESVHLFACKKSLGVGKKTPNNLVYGETGRYPLYVDSTMSTIRYWFKVINMDPARIPRQAYEREKLEINHKTTGWAKGIKQCLETNGFAEIWINEGTNNENKFMKTLKQRLIDCYKQNWHEKLESSERFATYRSFKNTHKKECHLDLISISKFRKAFTRIRIGVADINNNKALIDPQANTDCPFCNKKEDETHFILECPIYADFRQKFIFRHWPNRTRDIKTIFQTDNTEAARGVSMFCYYALKRREETI